MKGEHANLNPENRKDQQEKKKQKEHQPKARQQEEQPGQQAKEQGAENVLRIENLRAKAEAILKMEPEALRKLAAKDIEVLIHELGVHQIEIEMQNDELRQKQAELLNMTNRYKDLADTYRDLYDFAPVGYFTIEYVTGLIIGANLTGAGLLGVAREKLIGRPLSQFIDQDSQDIFFIHTRDVMETLVDQTCELRMKNEDGREFYAELKSIAATDKEGQCASLETRYTCFRTALSDITERKAAQQELQNQRDRLEDTVAALDRTVNALRESEARYSALVEQAMDGVVVAQDGVCRFANEAAAGMLGYSVEEMVGKTLADLVAPESRDMVIERNRARQAGERVPSFYEARLQDKSGAKREVEISAGLIHYDGKRASMAIVRDITERKRTEDEIRKIQRLESLGVLAGGIAHDFRNILTSITGGVSLAKFYVRGESRITEILDTIERGATRAKDLSEQLLTFARGGAPIKKITSFQELVRSTVDFTLKGSNSRSQLILPEDLWLVEIDPGQISQVLNNLILNASQAMPKGGTITIRAENITIGQEEGQPSEEQHHEGQAYEGWRTLKGQPPKGLPLGGGNYVRVSVHDEGVGIPEENIGKIFDPYFTTRDQGSGLGLATVFSIIRRHEGYITVDSEVEAGTTFSFYLPAIPVSTRAGAGEAEGKALPGKAAQLQAAIERERILVMEDDATVRNITGQLLNHLGYECDLAWNADEAIRLYKQALESGRSYSMVILDLVIQGGIDGRETLQKLQEIDPEVKAIVSSGYSNDPILANYSRHGFKASLAKPFDIGELAKTLQKVTS
ncbi:MAG: PAS domain S-box protein [bacterium]